ncbi:retrovirus-related Pol polyprotein from transposon 17.6 [Trichonephila clavipes]|nr:retrovirus-related Pol polyprotein from transposon 17.6 [Trichonephila clavipes]
MEQQIADLLRQNQDLIRALQIREDSHSHKVTVQFEKFDEENENFDSFIERFETYLDVQNVPIANRAKILWSKDCQVAFEQIKKEICSPKILVHYDPSLPLTLANSDASPVGIGCVLSHVYPDGSERPIAFASRTLSGSEKNTPKLIRKLFQ